MPVEKLFFHIGLHKTGTTFLQNALGLNRRRLADAGLLYYADDAHLATGRAHHSLALSLRRQPHPDMPCDEPRASVWDRFVRACDGFDGGIALNSSEVFCEGIDLDWLKRRLAGRDVTFVVYLREPVGMLASLYSEAVKHGQTLGLEAYAEQIRDHRLDYPAILAPWENAFGRQALVVRDLGRATTTTHDLLDDLLGVVGLPATTTASLERPERSNTRYPAAVVDALAAFNRLPLGRAERIAFRDALDAMVRERPEFRQLPVLDVPPALAARIRAHCADHDRELARRYGDGAARFFDAGAADARSG